MNFRIADTFTDSLAKLTGEEQKVVKTTAFDLQLNLANPGMNFHNLNACYWESICNKVLFFDARRSFKNCPFPSKFNNKAISSPAKSLVGLLAFTKKLSEKRPAKFIG